MVREVPIASVAALLERAAELGLALTPTRPEFDTMGLDFLVVHAVDAGGTPWIVRTPRRGEVSASMAIEERVLALVGPRLAVEVPDWRVYAPDIVAYPRISGIPAVTLGADGPTWNLDAKDPPTIFIEGFARMLAGLQAVAAEEARAAGVPVRTIAEVRASLVTAVEATREVLAPSEAVWNRWQRWLADETGWPDHVAMVHGDLHPGHMLLAEDGEFVGVLDWTEACVSDPAIDLALFYGCFGRAATERVLVPFVRAGGKIWPGMVEHAAERWAVSPATAAEWALRTGNEAVLEHARTHLAAITAETEAAG